MKDLSIPKTVSLARPILFKQIDLNMSMAVSLEQDCINI